MFFLIREFKIPNQKGQFSKLTWKGADQLPNSYFSNPCIFATFFFTQYLFEITLFIVIKGIQYQVAMRKIDKEIRICEECLAPFWKLKSLNFSFFVFIRVLNILGGIYTFIIQA